MEGQELVPVERGGAVATYSTDNPIADMMRAVVERGITADNAAAFQTMCDTVLKMDALQARKQYMAAMAKMQAEMPHVMATNLFLDDKGRTRAKWAKHEDIMQVIGPHLVRNGFSVSFDTEVDEKRTTDVCKISHVGGHSESTRFAVRNSKGPPGCSDAQADGSNHTYAMRYALCAALNIVIDKDADARIEGAVVTPEVARELQEAVKASGASEATFLTLANATSFATIRDGRVDMLWQALADRKAKMAPVAKEPPAVDPAASGTPTDDATAPAETLFEARAAAPSELRQRVHSVFRAIAKHRGTPFEKQWNAAMAKMGTDGEIVEHFPENRLAGLMVQANRVLAMNSIDASP
ncbi:MAG: ERF family protein, partial [Acidobacteria bacterium]|nr:ERF family protein [Acidobacteriota bacterium]